MFAPIDFSRIETALATPRGWAELGIVAACFAAGWAVDRRVRIKTEQPREVIRVGLGGVNRLLLPFVTLVLLLVAHAVFRRFHAPFFLSIALPLIVALAAIRLVVYALRGVFGNAPWMKASERAIAFTMWGAVLLYFTGVLPQVADELEALQLPIGRTHISMLEILKGIAVVLVTLAATLWLSGLIERQLMQARHIDSNLRVVLAKFIRAVLLVLAVLIALQAVGIDLTLLAVLGGAMGVGIGLGLQKLAANYIAGFTILLDRSVRMGDMITVDNRVGVVSKVTSRYVVVKSLDGIEAIVPNETMITTTVLNHSYSSREIRMAINVQVSYDSDVDRALRLMEETALGQPRVLRAPSPPAAYLVRFADSGIDLELGIWINDPENGQLNLKSAINESIWRKFRDHGIRIPFPQREVRIVGAARSAGVPGQPI